jgi:LPXTG-motif cell wall-anchored protein
MITKFRSAAFALLIAGAVVVPTTAAMADDYTVTPPASVTPPAVQPVTVVQPAVSAPVAVLGVSQVAPAQSGATLPFTGGDVAGLVVIGVVLLGGGAILVRRNRSASAPR